MIDEKKLIEEIEKLKSNLIHGACSSQVVMETRCKEEAYNEVLTILNSMQKEHVNEDLEEAAWLYYDKNRLLIPPELDLHKEFIDFFKAGAEWQKDKMMAKAINTEASLTMSVPSICISLPLGVNAGDKVKVIVIKED